MKRIIKNALMAARRNEIAFNENMFENNIEIYEHGYIVSMYHQAANPQYQWVITKKYKKDIGEKLYEDTVHNLPIFDISELTEYINKEINKNK